VKALVHIGMPKAGSTSIQWALRKNADYLLQRHRVFSDPGSGELNDWRLYDMIMSGATETIEDYVGRKLEAGREAGAETVIFSAERLFALPDLTPQLCILLDALERRGAVSIEIAVIVRPLRAFLRSYIKQLLANGGLELSNGYLATWICLQLNAAIGMPATVKALSFEEASRDGKLISNFLSLVLGAEVQVPEMQENVSSNRPYWFISMLGQACKFRAALIGRDINSPEVDTYRIILEERFDAIVASQFDLLPNLKLIDTLLTGAMDDYISTSIGLVRHETMEIYNNICSSPLTVFEYGAN